MCTAMQNSHERKEHEIQRNCLFWWTWLDFYNKILKVSYRFLFSFREKNLEEKSLCQEKKSCHIVYTISIQHNLSTII